MAHRRTSKRSKARTILRLPGLEQSKNAVLDSLAAASAQESYSHAIDELTGWYCSEPRLALKRTVVLRYWFFLPQKNLAPSTINVRLAAVRRLAYEASDTGLLSPELAAGIRRVKGAKRLGVRIGNWLTLDQSKALLGEPLSDSLRGKRDRAILALLVGCGLRRLAGKRAITSHNRIIDPSSRASAFLKFNPWCSRAHGLLFTARVVLRIDIVEL